MTGAKPLGHEARLADGIAHVAGDFANFGRSFLRPTRQLLLQHLTHQFDPRQTLTETVMQILPNTLALTVADLENFALKPASFRDVTENDQPMSNPARLVPNGSHPPFPPAFPAGYLIRSNFFEKSLRLWHAPPNRFLQPG